MMRTKIFSILMVITMLFVTCFTFANTFFDKSVKIYIGYQSVTAQTWSALIIKNKKIFENKLKQQFPNVNYKIVWSDEISGAVINTSMISGKCHFGFMGDMPLILNMNKSNSLESFESSLLCFCGKGDLGKNQAIVVSKTSGIKRVEDLKGKKVSVPIGSSAHFMLLKILEKYNIINDVEIVHQDIALASQMLDSSKSDAFAIWAPYPNFLTYVNKGNILIDGSESNEDYLAGVMVDKKWAQKNSKIVELFKESIIEANEFIINNQEESAKIFSHESGFDIEITKKELANINWICNLNRDNVDSLSNKMSFLVDNNLIGTKFELANFLYC